jgi:predicted membrane-bound dolichyl-phosphate-mannose-protein mannosyltransferase
VSSSDNYQHRNKHGTFSTSRLHSFFTWFTHKENITVCAIAAIILGLHLSIITKPSFVVPNEDIYVRAARSFLTSGGLLNSEHAPLGKLFIAAGIFTFGDNALGWRIFSVIFGVASIFIFYVIAVHLCRKEVNKDDNITLGSPVPTKKQLFFTMTTFVPVFATFLFAFENLSFVLAHLALLDVFYVTFMLLGFLLYLRGQYWWCGFAMGLSMLCKVMAFMAILAIVFYWALTRRNEVTAKIRHILKTPISKNTWTIHGALWDMAKVLISVAVTWFVLLPLLEYPATHQLANPISQTLEMLRFHLNFTSSPSLIATAPWTWVSSPTSFTYWPLSLSFVSNTWVLAINSNNPLYLAAISWNIWALIIPSMLYIIYETIRYRARQHNVATFVLSWFFGVYLLLIPLELATGRLMFTDYFYPAIPAVCMAISWSAWKMWLAMQKEKKRKVIFMCLFAFYLTSTVTIFFFMSPFGGRFLFGR